MRSEEILRLQAYMRNAFRLSAITVRRLGGREDTAEVMIGDEFIGTVSRDEGDDGDYTFMMPILGFDLSRGTDAGADHEGGDGA